MSEKTVFPSSALSKEVSVLKKQLAIALKFHHSQTIKRLPKEIALQVMGEVWESCHPHSADHSLSKVTYPSASVAYDEVPVTKEQTIYL